MYFCLYSCHPGPFDDLFYMDSEKSFQLALLLPLMPPSSPLFAEQQEWIDCLEPSMDNFILSAVIVMASPLQWLPIEIRVK